MVLRIAGCPRCKGTLTVDHYHGSEIATCISCGYEVENKLPGRPVQPPKEIQYPQLDEMSTTKLAIHMRGDTIEFLYGSGMCAANIGAIVGTNERTVYRWLNITEGATLYH